MTSDKSQLGPKPALLFWWVAVVAFFLICPSLQSAEENEKQPVVDLREALDRDGHRGMLSAAEAGNLRLPPIPSAWHVEHVMNPEERAVAHLWRDLGGRIVTELDKEARLLKEASTVQRNESSVVGLLDLAEWCAQSEGYGNAMLQRRGLDLASVGIAKLLLNLDYPQERCDKMFARLAGLRMDREVARRILNQEAGAELFPPGSSEEDMQRVWGNGRILLRNQLNPTRKLKRPDPIPETPNVARNLPFFADTDWPASVTRTAQSTWNVKWHERIVNGLNPQNLERVSALARFRKAVGTFPAGQDSGDALRPGPEGVFYNTWLAHGDGQTGQNTEQWDQYRRVGFAAWDAYDRASRGVFVDEDAEAAALQKAINE